MSVCPACGKRRYPTRKEARKWAKRLHPGKHMSPYRCGEFWHLGHLPADITKLGIDRSVLRTKRSQP